MSHTRAVLVERAAEATWRLRRSVRVEAARLRDLANAASHQFDAARRQKLERAVALLDTDPMAAGKLLESDATGIDQLLIWWDGLDEILAEGPDAWDSPEYHARLMVLLGHEADADVAEAGPMLVTSLRLLLTNDPEAGTADDGPFSDEEAVDNLRFLIEDTRGELRALRARGSSTRRSSASGRSTRPASTPPPRRGSITATRWPTTARSGPPSPN